MVKFVDGDQPVVKGFHAETLYGEAEGGVGTDQRFVATRHKRLHRFHLTAIFSRRVAEVPAGLHRPVVVEAELRQRLVGEAGADRLFRHRDNCLFDTLLIELVEGDEHQRPALSGSWGRFEQQVLLAALVVGALLHGAHAEFVGFYGAAGGGVVDG